MSECVCVKIHYHLHNAGNSSFFLREGGMKKALLFPFISSTRRKQLQLTALPRLCALAAREILEDHHLASKRKNKIKNKNKKNNRRVFGYAFSSSIFSHLREPAVALPDLVRSFLSFLLYFRISRFSIYINTFLV